MKLQNLVACFSGTPGIRCKYHKRLSDGRMAKQHICRWWHLAKKRKKNLSTRCIFTVF